MGPTRSGPDSTPVQAGERVTLGRMTYIIPQKPIPDFSGLPLASNRIFTQKRE